VLDDLGREAMAAVAERAMPASYPIAAGSRPGFRDNADGLLSRIAQQVGATRGRARLGLLISGSRVRAGGQELRVDAHVRAITA
jgi:hypothetical protein